LGGLSSKKSNGRSSFSPSSGIFVVALTLRGKSQQWLH
jgi:hypothetical protein